MFLFYSPMGTLYLTNQLIAYEVMKDSDSKAIVTLPSRNASFGGECNVLSEIASPQNRFTIHDVFAAASLYKRSRRICADRVA